MCAGLARLVEDQDFRRDVVVGFEMGKLDEELSCCDEDCACGEGCGS